MRNLSEIIMKDLEALYEKYGVFFAFNTKQFEEKKKPNTDYAIVISGMICPRENVSIVIESIDRITKKGVEIDIAENGIDAIILRELYNRESFYTGCMMEAYESLNVYNVTKEQVYTIFLENLGLNDIDN